MIMPGRKFNADQYRFGFNGMEADDELKGTKNSYATEFRLYDPRITNWLTVDPEFKSFPWQSPYVAMSRNPISRIDPLGNSDDWVEKTKDDGSKSIEYDEKVTSFDDPDLQPGDKYLGKEGYSINEQSGQVTHYKPDKTINEYNYPLPTVNISYKEQVQREFNNTDKSFIASMNRMIDALSIEIDAEQSIGPYSGPYKGLGQGIGLGSKFGHIEGIVGCLDYLDWMNKNPEEVKNMQSKWYQFLKSLEKK